MSEFQREERYIVLKLSRLPVREAAYLRAIQKDAIVESVVVEADWPEYDLVWLMLAHRMSGKPVPDFNAVRCADELKHRIGELADLLQLSLDALCECRALLHAHAASPQCSRSKVHGEIGLARIDRLTDKLRSALPRQL